MKAFKRIIGLVFGAALLATNVFASYTVAPAKSDPQRLRWKGNTVRLALSASLFERNFGLKSGTDVEGAIERSLAHWSNAAGLEFVLEKTDARNVSASGIAGDGVSLITIAASPENVLLFANDPLTESARTRVFFNRRGVITEADIVLNPYQQFSSDGTIGTFDLEATLTHEIGHLLGLRHSSVLGSVMSEGILRNSATAAIENVALTLSDSDLASVRDLYGFQGPDGDCCAVISGKLSQSDSWQTAPIRVWAEDNDTGKVVAQDELLGAGGFRLGGLMPGVYSVFWQGTGSDAQTAIGQLGTFRVSSGQNRILNDKVDPVTSDVGLSFIGLNGQLADSAVTLSGEREYTIYLGGKDLEHQRVSIEFNSPYFRAVPGSVKQYDFGNDRSAVSFILSVDPNAPRGVYSLFLTNDDGILAALVGGLRVAGGIRN